MQCRYRVSNENLCKIPCGSFKMNVEICFLTNACQASLPNLTKFNQTAHLADDRGRRAKERESEERKENMQLPLQQSKTME